MNGILGLSLLRCSKLRPSHPFFAGVGSLPPAIAKAKAKATAKAKAYGKGIRQRRWAAKQVAQELPTNMTAGC